MSAKKEIVKLGKDVGDIVRKNNASILMGLSVGGFIGCAVSVGCSTPKALMLIEEKKLDLDKDKLSPVETFTTVWFCYLPAAFLACASIMCLLKANDIQLRHYASLAGAYALSESTLKEYKNKVIETVGEKKEKDIRDSLAKDRVDKNPVTNTEVIITEKGESLCLEPLSGRYFKSDIEKIRRAINEVNRRLILENYISLNDLYDELGLEYTELGDDLGWRLDSGLLEVDYSTQLASDGSPCLVMDFVSRPMHDYSKWL